jgi:hypothetical protein
MPTFYSNTHLGIHIIFLFSTMLYDWYGLSVYHRCFFPPIDYASL